MRKELYRVLFVSLIMILSSLAGCIGDDEEETKADFGKIMVSTYHVGELVSAIVGDTAEVELMSTSNIPVHDYEPSLQDIVRLQESEAFFYHGLGLEPWVEATLSNLGSDAPPSYAVHTMPSGEITLDYESLLVSSLCDELNNGLVTTNTLQSYKSNASNLEIHLEKGVQSLTFPAADGSHDDHDHGDHDDEDGHDEDGHDEDGHDGHGHDEEGGAPEKVIENPEACPANTVISVYHLEEGEHIVEFSTNWWARTTFDMTAQQMLGGHAHHDHGDHGDEDGHDENGHSDGNHSEDGHDEAVCHNTETHENTEHTNKEDCEAAGHMWMEDHDGHGDEPVCHNSTTHENTNHTTEEECEAAGHVWMEDHDDHEEPNDGTRGYLTIHVENEGDYGFAVPSDISIKIMMSHDGEDGHDEESHGDEDGHDEESEIVADEDEEAFEYDPHSWLDPLASKAQTQLVLDALIEQFPAGNETFTANAAAFMLELDKIHLGYTTAFGEGNTCTTLTAAANHNAYSYITIRYGIEFVTVHGLDPEGEPTVADIAKVIEKINEDEVNVLFIEEYTDASAVSSIVKDTGVQVLYLYTMEISPSDANDTYLSMMNKNLENLKTGLGCTV